MKPFKMALPKTLDGAVSSCGLSLRETKLLAGGTDLIAELKERIQTPSLVVNLKTVPGLDQVRRTARGLEIGALVTLSELLDSEVVGRGWSALAQTAERTATPHIRNRATVGGNLFQRVRCWYYRDETFDCLKKGGKKCYAQEGENEFHSIFDNDKCAAVHPSNLAPVLMAYGATVDIISPDGTKSVPVEELFVSPKRNPTRENVLRANQIVTTIILPPESENRSCAYVETREKESFDWAVCGATVRLDREGDRVRSARVVLNAVAPTPMRRPDLEAMVEGQRVDGALVERVCRTAAASATPLAQNGYKVALLKVVLKRAFQQAMKG